MDEVVQSLSGKAAMTIQVALAAAEQVAYRRAAQLQAAARESEDAQRRMRAQYRAEADLHAARWAAAAKHGPEWIDAYASAVAWRELDPRAAQAAERIEDRMQRAGFEIPDTNAIRAHNQDAVRAGYLEGAEPAASPRAEQAAREAEERSQRQDELHQAEEWAQANQPEEYQKYRNDLMGSDYAESDRRIRDDLVQRWKSATQAASQPVNQAADPSADDHARADQPGQSGQAPEARLAQESHPQGAAELVQGARTAPAQKPPRRRPRAQAPTIERGR